MLLHSGIGHVDHEMIPPGTDLSQVGSITDVVDATLLPKAIGGDVVSFDEDGTEDETCTRGVAHPRWSAFVKSLEESRS